MKDIDLVKKYLDDPELVSLEELEENALKAYIAAAKAHAAYAFTRSAYAADTAYAKAHAARNARDAFELKKEADA